MWLWHCLIDMYFSLVWSTFMFSDFWKLSKVRQLRRSWIVRSSSILQLLLELFMLEHLRLKPANLWQDLTPGSTHIQSWFLKEFMRQIVPRSLLSALAAYPPGKSKLVYAACIKGLKRDGKILPRQSFHDALPKFWCVAAGGCWLQIDWQKWWHVWHG